MDYDCIFINGDSYSAPLPNIKTYGDFLSEHYKIPVKNLALPGSNNPRILRTSIEQVHKLKEEYNNPLVLVGWTFIRRTEVWYHGNHQGVLKAITDSEQSRFVSLDMVVNYGEATLEQKAIFYDEQGIHKQLMDYYTNLYMFAHTLEAKNIDYRFFSSAKNTAYPIHSFPYINSLAQVQWVANNPRIFKLDEFCVSDWAKENDPDHDTVSGHLSEDGHKKFTRFILDNLID